MIRLVTCLACRWFRPWPQNPTAAMGRCERGHGHWYPRQSHACDDHAPVQAAQNPQEFNP